MTAVDPYRTLGVDEHASHEAIREAYRALARRFHPDVSPGNEAQARMVQINAAWELIGDEQRRAEWDRANGLQRAARGGRAASSAGSAAPGQGSPPSWSAGRYHPGGNGWSNGHTPGTGAAGAPPGRPSGSVLDFGRHIGWSLGEIARVDPGYLLWLESKPEGRRYAEEIDDLLRRLGVRRSEAQSAAKRRRRFGLS
ncbi:MAG: DnaJ domain-containing protein [Candidatus Limnocylindrales bacterium]